MHKITNYFSFPQKRASLKRIQEQKNLPTLYPIKLGATRWLSLGQSLVRLTAIWESLHIYFTEITQKKKLPKRLKKYNKRTVKGKKEDLDPSRFFNLLNDHIFFYKIKLWHIYLTPLMSSILCSKIPNLIFQRLKQINNCWNLVLDLALKPFALEVAKKFPL